MTKKPFVETKMSFVTATDIKNEVRTMLHEMAEPRPVGDSVDSAVWRATRRLQRDFGLEISFGRARRYWYRLMKVQVEDYANIKTAIEQRRENIAEQLRRAYKHLEHADAADRQAILADYQNLASLLPGPLDPLGAPDRGAEEGEGKR